MFHHIRTTRAATRAREAAEAQAAYSAGAQTSAIEIPGAEETPNQTQADETQADETQADQTETNQNAMIQKFGILNSKLTSYHQNEDGWSEANMPNLLFQLEPGQDWGLEPYVPYLAKNDGTKLTNNRGLRMIDYDFLPDQISIVPEPFRLEMYLGRLHSRCISSDLHDRMNPGPKESVPSPNAVNMSRLRLRDQLNIPCWTKRRETPSQLECLILEQVSSASMRLNTVLPVGATGLLKPTCIVVDHSKAPFHYYDMPRDTAHLPHVTIPFKTFIGDQAVHVPGPRLESVLNTVAELQALAFEQGYPHWIFLKNRDKPKIWGHKARMQHHANSGPNDISVPPPQALPRISLLWIEFCIQKAVENNEMHLPLDKLTKATRNWVEDVIAWAEDEIEGVPEVEMTGTQKDEPSLASTKVEDNDERLNRAVGWAGDAIRETPEDAMMETPLPTLDLAIATAADIDEWLRIAGGQTSDNKPGLATATAEYDVKPGGSVSMDRNGWNRGCVIANQVEHSNVQRSLPSTGFNIPTAHANPTVVATEWNNEMITRVPYIEAGRPLALDRIKTSRPSPLTTEPAFNPALWMEWEAAGGWNAGAETQIEVMELDHMEYNIPAVLDLRLYEQSGNMLVHKQNPPPPPYGQFAPVANMDRELHTYMWVRNQIEQNQVPHQDEEPEIRPCDLSERLMNEPHVDNPNLFPDLPQIPDHYFFEDQA